jgi:DNA-binding FadR family transcriptional regulator
MARVNVEHESILDAIARRDPEGARAAMRMHLSSSRERLRRLNVGASEEGVERTA